MRDRECILEVLQEERTVSKKEKTKAVDCDYLPSNKY